MARKTPWIRPDEVGIADDAILSVDDAAAADDEFARFTADGIEGLNVADTLSALSVTSGADVTADNAPKAHAASHLPAGGDPLTTAAAAEISTVVAAGAGAAESFAKSDHVHAINHAITDNHLATVDGTTNVPVNGDYAKFTALGLEGKDKAGMLSDLNVADGADVTGSNAPQAHKDTHDPNDGGDALDTANAAEVSAVVAAGTGTSHSLARADHVHAIAHAISDNHLVTIDSASVADDEYARFTASGLESRTAQEVLTDLLGQTLLENESIKLDAVLSADGKYTGITRVGTAGAILAFGDVAYYAVADGKWELADADAASTGSGAIGICVLAAAEDAATNILLIGLVRAATFPALTAGAPVFLSCTAGDLASAVPAKATGDIVRVLGQAWTAEDLWFSPSADWYEYA